MTDFREFPDFEAVASAALRNAAIDGIGEHVYSSVPAKATEKKLYPLLTVKRIGGVPPNRRALDSANIQVDAWGNTKSEAHDAAVKARLALMQLEGTAVTDPVDAYISGVSDSLGLNWSPDPETGRDRYVFAVYLYGH